MKNLKTIAILSSLCVVSLAYSQNYGYNPYSQGPYQGQGYYNNPNQSGYYSQPYGQQNQQYYYGGNPQDNQYGQQGYSQNPQNSQDGNQSSWFGNDNKQQVPDDVIKNRITQNIRNTPYLSPIARNIQVDIKNGDVTLKGKVANENEGYIIEYMAKNVAGVQSVDNELESKK